MAARPTSPSCPACARSSTSSTTRVVAVGDRYRDTADSAVSRRPRPGRAGAPRRRAASLDRAALRDARRTNWRQPRSRGDAFAVGSADGQMSTRTQPAQFGLAGEAHLPAVQDQPEREATALLRRHEHVEVELGLHRVGLGRELEPARQPPDVRVDRQTGQVERHRAHDVAGLAPDARAASPGRRARSAPRRRSRPRACAPCRAGSWSSSGRSPVEWTSRSTSSGSACARSAGVGYLANSAGVTLLTFSSVVCADRIVATSSWNALSCTSAHSASGYSSASRARDLVGARLRTSRSGHPPNLPRGDALSDALAGSARRDRA